MRLFNGKLAVASVSSIQDKANEWKITGVFVDNSGRFMTNDIMIDHVVYAYSLNDTEEKNMTRYVVSLINSISGATFDINVKWDDDPVATSFYGPEKDFDIIIGEKTQGNMMAISNRINSIGEEIITDARNVDIKMTTLLNGPDIDGGTF